MVLKVFTGKILETLELSHSPWLPKAWTDKPAGSEPLSIIQLSKITYYLVDNIYALYVIGVVDEVQEESERTEKLVPKMGNR
jgi:hypothetical protein